MTLGGLAMSVLNSRTASWQLTLLGFGLVAIGTTGCQVDVGGQTLPSAYWMTDDVQYFPPGPEFKLSREAAELRLQRLSQGRPRPLGQAAPVAPVPAPAVPVVPGAPPAPAPGIPDAGAPPAPAPGLPAAPPAAAEPPAADAPAADAPPAAQP